MAAVKLPLWKRWWVWCAGCLALAGIVVLQQRPFPARQQQLSSSLDSSEDLFGLPGDALAPPAADSRPPSSAKSPTTGDSQVDAFIRDELRHWQSEFEFTAEVREILSRRAIQVFGPFLLFHGGRDALRGSIREAHAEAVRLRRRRGTAGLPLAQAGREEAQRRGLDLLNLVEVASADWLQDKTLASVDAEVPQGGLSPAKADALRLSRGSIANGAGNLVWAGPADFPAEFNGRIAAVILQWVDEFRLPQEEVATLSKTIVSRLLVLQPGPGGESVDGLARMRACDEGIQWLQAAREEARPLFARTGWVNLPRLVRLSREDAARVGHFASGGDSGSLLSPVALANSSTRVVQAGWSSEAAPRDNRLKAPFERDIARGAQRLAAVTVNAPTEMTNSVGMRLVLVPAGEFQMGSSPEQLAAVKAIDKNFKREWERAESPAHRVRIGRPFYLGRHEVTRAQFAAFVQATGYRTDSQRDAKGGAGLDEATGEAQQSPAFDWQNPGFRQQENEPVVNVSWNDAVAFCNWLSQKEGRTYRLPSEAEWEFACRAGTASLFPCGNDPEALATIANIADATAHTRFGKWATIGARDGYAFTAPVGSFHANAFGLCDMIGNVWEWCADWYGGDYYAKSPEPDPRGPPKGSVRVFRGGSWYDAAALSRCAFRYWDLPTYRDYFLGFRVAAEVEPR